MLSLPFPFFICFGGAGGYAVPVYSSTATTAVVFTYDSVVVCQNLEHSPAQQSTAQSPLHKAASKFVRADQSKYVRTCMRRPGCFSGAWSSWHLQVASLHLKCWTMYYIRHSNPFFLVSERSGRNRLLRYAPCNKNRKCQPSVSCLGCIMFDANSSAASMYYIHLVHAYTLLHVVVQSFERYVRLCRFKPVYRVIFRF